MTTFQIIIIGIGLLLGVGSFGGDIKSIFSSILSFFKKDEDVPELVESEQDSLAELVLCWERLQRELDRRGLDEASSELVKIFPMFIQEKSETGKGE